MALISPWAWSSPDYQGNVLSVTFTFDNALFTLLTVTGHRDPGCVYSKFYMGVGADGVPDSTASQFTLAAGDSVVAVAVLSGFGFTTINDVLARQATAGP